jgi:hypothetical protein
VRRIVDPIAPSEVLARLAAPPRPPLDPARFTPDLYPEGPPLVPAVGSAPGDAAALAALERAGVPDARVRFDHEALVARAPDPGVRAGLVALAGTVAEPVLDAFVAGALEVTRLTFGAPAAGGRIVGPPRDGATGARVVNARYVAENPVLFAPSLAHDLCWRATGAGRAEETLLHAIAAIVHVQRLAEAPGLADVRTELARRQHSLAITLLLSRHPGSSDVCLVAPDGLGTLPGGAPAMATPDFWSVPFGAGESTEPVAPVVVTAVLRRVFGAHAPVPDPLRYDADLTALCARPLADTGVPPAARLRAAIALGLIEP